MKKIYKNIIIIVITLGIITPIYTNLVVIAKSSKYINKEINYDEYKYIIVLGAKVSNNTPSLMLKDRLDKAIEIYNKNRNIKVIISGDSADSNVYDEVGVMQNYLINNGVSIDNIIKDNYGVSTYDSIIRMKNIVNDDNVIIITQKYHLYRSVYIAREFNINGTGISSIEYKYFGQLTRDIREILARMKDYFLVKFEVKSKY